MRIVGPETYTLTCTPNTFAVVCSLGTPKFSNLASSRIPKLYIVAIDVKPIYVGITKQPMRSRLRYGFLADGKHGYHGYAWRHKITKADLSVWFQEDSEEGSMADIEAVEAEVVFLARKAGQWPLYQTEIHFHQSDEMHRSVAAKIWSMFNGGFHAGNSD